MASATPGRSAARPSQARVASPGSPTRMSRIQEKEELRHLNDRLAAYIERVRSLESDKAVLRLQLDEREDVRTREVSNLKKLYNTELADARKLLDQTANERARLQVDLGQLREEHRQLQARNCKKESDLSQALLQVRDLDSKLNAKEADLVTLLCQNRSLDGEMKDLKSQINGLESSSRDTTKQLQEEMLWRVDLENKLQTLKEQKEFEKTIYEQEVQEMKKRYETKLVEMESGRQIEFESKLAEALQELRSDHEQQIKEYKEQLERTFSAKLENAQLAAAKNSDYANATREEIVSTKLRLDSLASQLTQYQQQNTALESKRRSLEEMLQNAHDLHRRQMNEKDREVAEMRHQLQTQLDEYEQLLDVKLALDMEINAYRKMLEGEEERLKLSPSPSQRSRVSRTSSRMTRGKKRKLEESQRPRTGRMEKTIQQGSCIGPVCIEEIDPEGKYVRLLNNSEEDQHLHGWKVKRQHRSLPDIVYKFPGRFVLGAGQSVTAMHCVINTLHHILYTTSMGHHKIWASCAGAVHSPPSDLVWQDQSCWDVGDDVKVTLLDCNRIECAERILKLDIEGADVDEEFCGEAEFHSQSHQPVDPSCSVM